MPKDGNTHVGLQLLTDKAMNHVARRMYVERVVQSYLEYTGQKDYFKVTMPCGAEYVFGEKNIPSEILLCRCQNPRHIVVLWRFSESGKGD